MCAWNLDTVTITKEVPIETELEGIDRDVRIKKSACNGLTICENVDEAKEVRYRREFMYVSIPLLVSCKFASLFITWKIYLLFLIFPPVLTCFFVLLFCRVYFSLSIVIQVHFILHTVKWLHFHE